MISTLSNKDIISFDTRKKSNLANIKGVGWRHENLFSIIRKNIIRRSPMYPDAKHIHQLVFFSISKKYDLSIFLANTLTAQIINFYNLIIFSMGLFFITNSEIQILLILFSVGMYTLAYVKLFKFKYQKSV